MRKVGGGGTDMGDIIQSEIHFGDVILFSPLGQVFCDETKWRVGLKVALALTLWNV